jgi:hypothetical protein
MSTLPPSGISAYQSDIMYPEGVNENWGPDQENNTDQQEDVRNSPRDDLMMKLYSTQTFLRVVLNVAHNALYGPNGRMSFDPTNFKEVARHALTHADILEFWRYTLTTEQAWKDTDPPSTDLNIARVRAKYYGGLYMVLRPYLKLASHELEFPTRPSDLTENQKEIIGVAIKCINSAIQSTVAFDRVDADPNRPYANFAPTRTKRLVVTNIFGTLHA